MFGGLCPDGSAPRGTARAGVSHAALRPGHVNGGDLALEYVAVPVRQVHKAARLDERDVETGIADTQNVEIISGVNEGDTVFSLVTKEYCRYAPSISAPPKLSTSRVTV